MRAKRQKARWYAIAVEGYPAPGTACWVVAKDEKGGYRALFLAVHEPEAAGQWTNGDCWEDYEDEVTHWWPVTRPKLPRELRGGKWVAAHVGVETNV